jgi:hypothetical protein
MLRRFVEHDSHHLKICLLSPNLLLRAGHPSQEVYLQMSSRAAISSIGFWLLWHCCGRGAHAGLSGSCKGTLIGLWELVLRILWVQFLKGGGHVWTCDQLGCVFCCAHPSCFSCFSGGFCCYIYFNSVPRTQDDLSLTANDLPWQWPQLKQELSTSEI